MRTTLALLAAQLAAALASSAGTYTYITLQDESAKCLDGSPYGFFICKGASNANWTISIQGGGELF